MKNPARDHVWRARPPLPSCALTFDDGPNGAVTLALLDFLAEREIRAVFCVIGECIQNADGAAVLRRTVRDGHLLANHSTTFADMGAWPAVRVRDDLLATLAIIRSALDNPSADVPYFRAPNGSWGESAVVAGELGMRPLAVMNTIDDWQTQDVQVLTDNLRTAMRPGELVLAHDGGGDRWGTLAAIRTVVDERLAEGWRFTLPNDGTP